MQPIAMDSRAGNAIRTLPQILAVLGLILIAATVAHKGFVDISALAAKHSGQEFWLALAKHILRNLGGA